jgi:thioester reductase-like protein
VEEIVLMTGFPGFLGSALLPRLLSRSTETTAICVIQDSHQLESAHRLAEIEDQHPGVRERVTLATGDITAADLGLDAAVRRRLDGTTEVWHLAAVYDLAVPAAMAHRVNVGGTAHVLDLCRSLPRLRRLHHVSTCYVSGRYEGEFPEDGLDLGQPFRNHYEATKFAAERLVHGAMAAGLPATVYRPGIVVGDSMTGATQKFDGPYYVAEFLQRQLGPVALVPRVGDPDTVRVGLVPRDFVVEAMEALSGLEVSRGRTYALVDPDPPTAREVVTRFANHLGKHVTWVPLPLGATHALIDKLPGMERLLGLPAEAVDYFASPTTYSTTNATTDLEGTGVRCPPFWSYADRLLDYMLCHPEVGAEAMT